MALEFVDQGVKYISQPDVIRFFASEGDQPSMFVISREALEDLERTRKPMSEDKLKEAFDKHLEKIMAVAERVYDSEELGKNGARLLTTAHFG